MNTQLKKTMIAFHGDPKIKDKYVVRVKAHAAADEIIHGQYWENGKGCAVGCTVHSSKHDAYEIELGVPAAIAYLEDSIFESLSNGSSKAFPLRFIEAIPVGADLSMVVPQFIYWMLSDEAWGLKPEAEDVKKAVNAVSECYRRRIGGDEPTEKEWIAAGDAARDARAAMSAMSARDAWAAWDAWAARAAMSARDARDAWAAMSAWDARDARDAWDARDARDAWAARAAYREASAEKLLELLAAAPVCAAMNLK